MLSESSAWTKLIQLGGSIHDKSFSFQSPGLTSFHMQRENCARQENDIERTTKTGAQTCAVLCCAVLDCSGWGRCRVEVPRDKEYSP